LSDLVVSGVAVTLLDTAGMRSSSDLVEQLGVERSAAAAAAADVVIMVVDAEQGWTDADGDIFNSLWGKEGPGSRSCKVRGPALLVANKQDLAGNARGAARQHGRVFAALRGTGSFVRFVCLQRDSA
jgi:tRNA modification GTPase